ncbi:1-deoxy-D-xylulose 5-phosphate reductoisomerase [Geodia barretti]|uniref:1-deoxy-D-xylulose-5-phosphate reductoisomerase n=1 Tax=Geodia barretti TaxID=519541 RepID=A0AA35TP72_GEOBA|nr:1-deoxy-D-xylulose 5-phosphate reductoisomerase [Geodia barretti]
MRNIVVLGSTGSIGCQTLDIVRSFPDEFHVVGLAAGANHDLFRQQIAEFRPRHVYCIDPPADDMVCLPEVDVIMAATTGAAGLQPTLNALRQGKAVALSNKEPIVMAGPLLKDYERKYGGAILPVDSEPSAIWQCIQGETNEIRRLIITASGGPFRTMPLEEMAAVTPEQALNHPTWQMGPKITIDSATLMNKAFEVIESHWLFDVPWENIEVVVHPQSTIHSMVEFTDGSVKAQLGPPSMRLPIQYALFYPERRRNPDDSLIPRLDTSIAQALDFRPMEPERYPCFDLALATTRQGKTYPTALSAADEVAVNAFLNGKIAFTDIYRVVESVVNTHQPTPAETLEALVAADTWATAEAERVVGKLG